MSKRRKNAGEGYGYMFSGAFKKKSDAVRKEGTRKGSFVKGVETPQGHRYVVMTPRTNPRKKKAKKTTNPTELVVMAANPHQSHEITIPDGVKELHIRINPTNPDRYTSAHARAAGITRKLGGLIETPFQRRIARMARKASSSDAAILGRSYKRHKAEPRSRGAEKVFHELYGRNNPICGHIVSGEPCTRKPGHRGPCLPQGATMRPRSRLRNAWKPTRNPSAAALHATFTGREGKWIEVFNEPHMPKMDVAQLGELLALYVKPNSGGQVQQITFSKSARPLVVSDETARQIYFVGGDQNITPALAAFGARDRGGLHELGECTRIDYKQRKEHVPDPDADEWRHAFGEESGIRPVLLYDPQKQRLLLEGGEYQIRAEGIVN